MESLELEIYKQCMASDGFATLIRENVVDKEKFKRLIDAIKKLTEIKSKEDSVKRIIVACLFELPWEIENTIEHYNNKSQTLGKQVSEMAEELREVINEFLWIGLEEYYENID